MDAVYLADACLAWLGMAGSGCGSTDLGGSGFRRIELRWERVWEDWD